MSLFSKKNVSQYLLLLVHDRTKKTKQLLIDKTTYKEGPTATKRFPSSSPEYCPKYLM